MRARHTRDHCHVGRSSSGVVATIGARRRKERVRRGGAGGRREGSGGTERGESEQEGWGAGVGGGEGAKTSFNLGQLPAGAGAWVTEHPRLKKHTHVVLGIQRN